jgi:hypothetical protein
VHLTTVHLKYPQVVPPPVGRGTTTGAVLTGTGTVVWRDTRGVTRDTP